MTTLLLAAALACERLAATTLPNATVTSAQTVAAGALPQAPNLPEFCRIAVTLKPSSDSDIKMELWLPSERWNGKFQEVGNGAFSGSLALSALAGAVRRQYAAASTDTGHTGNTASFAIGHPEKVIDFGWRAVHETAVVSKTLLEAFYDRGASHAYFVGCSAGGRQALKEAQRFPADFDGIVAGAPGLDWTGRAAQAVRVAQATENESARLTRNDVLLLHAAVLDKCDALDGVKDGIIADPTRCAFDPGVLQCKGAAAESCLTPAKVVTARLLYSAVANPKTKREITALQPGSELGWTELGWTESARTTGLDQFRFLVFKDPTWQIRAFRFERDIAMAEDADHDTINALDSNLKPFIDRAGKLIQYHGWSDPQISPGNSTQYYQRALQALGGASKVDGSYRLFMAPGMGHCGGGEGPNAFDMLTALEQWVEQGKAPDRVVAQGRTSDGLERTRPLCPYPQVAEYKGSGSTDDAANFACRAR